MIFKLYNNIFGGGEIDIPVKASSLKISDMAQSENSVSITYLNGSTDDINFGDRTQLKTAFSLLIDSREQLAYFNSYVQSNLGVTMEIEQSQGEMLFGPMWDTLSLKIQIVKAMPKGEIAFSSERELNEIDLEIILIEDGNGLKVNDETNSSYNYLFEVEIPAISTTYTPVELNADVNANAPAPVAGDTMVVNNMTNSNRANGEKLYRGLIVFNGSAWELDFPLKRTEVTFWVENFSDLPQDNGVRVILKNGMTAWVISDRKYFVYEESLEGGNCWIDTIYPYIPVNKVVILDDYLTGLKFGKFYWSSFADSIINPDPDPYNRKPPFHKSGFIAKNGISMPTFDTALDTGPSVEKLNGYSVSISNNDRFHIETLSFNFFGSYCQLFFLDSTDPQNIIKTLVRSGTNRTNSFDFSNYKFDVDPLFLLNKKSSIPNTTVVDNFPTTVDNDFSGDVIPATYGSWKYAKLKPFKNVDSEVQFNYGGSFSNSAVVNGIGELTVFANGVYTDYLAFKLRGVINNGLNRTSIPFGSIIGETNSYPIFSIEDLEMMGTVSAVVNKYYYYKINRYADIFVRSEDLGLSDGSQLDDILKFMSKAFQARYIEHQLLIDKGYCTDWYNTESVDIDGVIEFNRPLSQVSVYKYDSDQKIYIALPPGLFSHKDSKEFSLQNSASLALNSDAYKQFSSIGMNLSPSRAKFTSPSEIDYPVAYNFIGTFTDIVRTKIEGFSGLAWLYVQDNLYGPANTIRQRIGVASIAPISQLSTAYPVDFEEYTAVIPPEFSITGSPLLGEFKKTYARCYCSSGISAMNLASDLGKIDSWGNRLSTYFTNLIYSNEPNNLIVSLSGGYYANTGQERLPTPMTVIKSPFLVLPVPPTLPSESAPSMYYIKHLSEGYQEETIGATLYYEFDHSKMASLGGAKDVRLLCNFQAFAAVVPDYVTTARNYSYNFKRFIPTVSLVLLHKTNNLLNLTISRQTFDSIVNLSYVSYDGSTSCGMLFNNYPNELNGGHESNYINNGDVNHINYRQIQGCIDGLSRRGVGGRDLFEAFPDYLFDVSAGFKINDYKGVQIVVRNATRFNNATAGFKFSLRPNSYNSPVDQIYMSAQQLIDVSSDDLYVSVRGRNKLDISNSESTVPSEPLRNPVEVAESIYKIVDPTQTIVSSNISNYKKFAIRTQINSSSSPSEELLKAVKHSWSTLRIDEQDGLTMASLDFNDYGEDVVAQFTEANVIRTTSIKVKYRNISEIIRDFKFKFHFDLAENDFKREISIKWNKETDSIDVSGFAGNSDIPVSGYRTQIENSIRIDLEDQFRRSKEYYNTGTNDQSMEMDFEFCYDDLYEWGSVGVPDIEEDVNSIYTVSKLVRKAIQFFLFNAWTVSFDTHIKYVINDTTLGFGKTRLQVGDFIELNTFFHTNNLPLRGFLKSFKPNPYTGTVTLTLFSPIPPDVYTLFYDSEWNQGVMDDNFDAEDYKHSVLMKYPFKNGPQTGTFSDSGNISDPSWVDTDYKFTDGSTADSEDPNIPY